MNMVHAIQQSTTLEKKKTAECLIEPITFEFKDSLFEYSVYKPSSRFLRDFDTIFPSLKEKKELLVVPIIQKCKFDMVGLTKEANEERDIKLEIFVEWGKLVVKRIESIGMWADIMDPASGFPILSEAGPSPYPDVQGTYMLASSRFSIQNVGCCHILLHPKWFSFIYPSTLFTTAPADILEKVINEVNDAFLLTP
ncbi:methylmalonic aciduria and homocystinuria type D protein [Cokeromyces recurvatus]|uniref:methylmalonic aciduria and homocystinuria type D protein n=1 Tax=Cokeromyces recurvatus TaxID=90255 RepID=UPI002220BC8B|nr:methylmalonic aciduria and homocystinuria type D protein [Cokeromyces recurvatus]KAI7905210.1 methylmalonic aciduria and homocystinuria type D protein [Cokeromyces recurvatus]